MFVDFARVYVLSENVVTYDFVLFMLHLTYWRVLAARPNLLSTSQWLCVHLAKLW